MIKMLSNPLVIGTMAAIITALVLFVYSMFTGGSKKIMVPQNPEDPDSTMIETMVPSDGFGTIFIAGSSLFVGILSAFLSSMALSSSGNDFDIEDVLDEDF